MAFLDDHLVNPPDVYEPDIPEKCWSCGCWLEYLEADGTCPECGTEIEP